LRERKACHSVGESKKRNKNGGGTIYGWLLKQAFG